MGPLGGAGDEDEEEEEEEDGNGSLLLDGLVEDVDEPLLDAPQLAPGVQLVVLTLALPPHWLHQDA